MNFLKTCADEFGGSFFCSKVGKPHRQNLALAQLAAFSHPCGAETFVDGSLLKEDAFVAAMMVGHKRLKPDGSLKKAMEWIKQSGFRERPRGGIVRQLLMMDGSFLQCFPKACGMREYVKLAVSPGPHDDFLRCKNRSENLRHADLSVYNTDQELDGFVRELFQLGCRKKDFPETFWQSFWGDRSHEEQCSFAATVLLAPNMEGVSKLGNNIWYDLPNTVTGVFNDCSTYQCGICLGIPVMVFNCIEGCMFHCCQDCREEMQGPCPMCRGNQKGSFGRRCRAAEVQCRANKHTKLGGMTKRDG